LRTVEVRDSRDIATDRAPGELYLLPRYVAIDLRAFRLERPVGDVFHQKKEELLLGYGIAVVILLATAEVLELRLLRLVR